MPVFQFDVETANASGPWRSMTSESRPAISFITSSQLAGTNAPSPACANPPQRLVQPSGTIVEAWSGDLSFGAA
jgi:hypothetical protein